MSMNDDFNVKAQLSLDTSKAEQQLKDLQNKKINLEVNAGNSGKKIEDINDKIKVAKRTSATFGDTLKRSLNIGAAATITAKGIRLISTAFREAIKSVKEFNSAVTDVRTVLGNSYLDAVKMVKSYNQLGKELGATTREVTNAAVTWLRQGKSIEETNKLIYETTKLSKIGFIDQANAATYLTSALNGYRLSADSASAVVDKLAKLDSSAAVTAGGLAEGMSRTAVSADMAGISMDRLLAYLATVGEVTQKSMNTVGEAFKTIFARMSAIKADKLELVDEDGTVELLSDVELTLKNVGIDLRKTVHEYNNFGEVLDNLAAKWSTLGQDQQNALAQAFAGTRRANDFRTLMQNYDKVKIYTDLAANSAGTAEKKFSAYLDSIEAKSKKLQASLESLAVNTLSQDTLGGVIDATNAIVQFLDKTNLLKGTLTGLATAGVIKAFAIIGTGISSAVMRLNEFNAALQLIKAGNIGEAQINQLALMTANLSQSQLKAVLSSRALSAEQRIAILTAQGLSTEEAKTALSTMGLATAEGTATGVTYGFTNALKGLWATLMANPLVLVVAGVTAATMAYSKYKQSVEDTRRKLEESATAASEQAKKTKESVDSLMDLKDRLNSGSESVDTLTDAFKEQLKTMGYTEDGIQTLIDKYYGLEDAIDSVIEKELKQARADAYNAKLDAASAIETSSKSNRFVDYEMPFDMPSELRGIINRFVNENKDKLFNFDSATGFFEISALSGSGEDILKYYTAIKDLYDKLLQYQSEHNADLKKLRLFGELEKDIEALTKDADLLQGITKQLNELDAQILGVNNIQSDEALDRYIADVEALTDKTAEDKEMMIQLGKASYETFVSSARATDDSISAYERLGNQISTIEEKLHDTSDIIGEMEAGKDILADATEEMEKNGEISNETVKALADMMDEGEDWLKYLKVENGQIKLNTELWKERILSKIQDNISALDDELEALNKQNDMLISQLSLIEARNKLLGGSDEVDLSNPFSVTSIVPSSFDRDKSAFLPDNVFPGMLNNEYGKAWRDQKAKEAEISEIEKRRDAFRAMYDSWLTDIDSITEGETELDEESRRTFNWIESMLDRIKRKVDSFSRTVSSKYKSLSSRNKAAKGEIAAVTKEIELQEKAYKKYLELADSINISESIKAMVRDGAIDISEYNEETAELIDKYKEWYEAALDARDAIDELHESLASIYDDEFNRIKTEYDNQIGLLQLFSNEYQSGIDLLEQKGYLASTKYYSLLSDTQNKNIELLEAQLEGMISAFNRAMQSGEIEAYSEAWYTMRSEINAVKNAISEAQVSLSEYAKTMREIEWSYFDYTQDRIASINSEAEFLIDLLDNNKLFDDKGNLTNEGLAVMGLYGQNYNVLMSQADAYRQEIEKLNAEIAQDPYNADLITRREELLKLQQESIKSAEEEKQAIVDLVSNGIEKELDSLKELIDAYKNALDSAKDLHDYEKRINDQTSDITALQKQILAFNGDTSEEAKATIQKLQVELNKAEQDLQETEYEHYISEQKKILDDLYSKYEIAMNQRLDDTNSLINTMIADINSNADTINSTLHMASSEVGYQMSDSLNKIWGQADRITAVISDYNRGFSNNLTTIQSVLSQIQANTSAMASQSNNMAQNNFNNTNGWNNQFTNGWNTGLNGGNTGWNNIWNDDGDITLEDDSIIPSPAQSSAIRIGDKIFAGGATIYRGSDGHSPMSQYYGNDPYYFVLGEQNGYYMVRHHSKANGITGWFRKQDVFKAYKKGGLVDYTGLAQVDGTPSEPESFLDAKDTKNVKGLTDELRKAGKDKLFIDNGLPETFRNITPDLIPTPNIPISSFKMPEFENPIINQSNNVDLGGININIDHVQDYNDLVTQMRNDPKFEKMMSDMIIGRIYTGNPFIKYRTSWKHGAKSN